MRTYDANHSEPANCRPLHVSVHCHLFFFLYSPSKKLVFVPVASALTAGHRDGLVLWYAVVQDLNLRILLYSFFISAGKPSGYDRVRNAEIGNKVRWWCCFTSRVYNTLVYIYLQHWSTIFCSYAGVDVVRNSLGNRICQFGGSY